MVHTARESRCGHRLVGVFALMRKITGLFMKSCLPLLLSVLLLLPFLPAASGALGWTDMMGPGNGSGRALVYDSVRGNLYRGTYSRGVWRYKSGAYTDMGLGNTNISDSAYDSANNILYVLSGGAVTRCANPDTSPVWTSLGRNAQSIAYDAPRNLIYAGSTAGVWRCATPDGTPSWIDVTGGLGTGYDIWDLEMDGAHDQVYVATSSRAGGHGVWRCDAPDTAPSWSDTGTLSTYYAHYLLYDVGHNKLYCGATKGFDSFVKGEQREYREADVQERPADRRAGRGSQSPRRREQASHHVLPVEGREVRV